MSLKVVGRRVKVYLGPEVKYGRVRAWRRDRRGTLWFLIRLDDGALVEVDYAHLEPAEG